MRFIYVNPHLDQDILKNFLGYYKRSTTVVKIIFRLLFSKSSLSRRLHSCLNRLAPVKEPSPPIHTKLLMPNLTRFLAACRRPHFSLNAWHRAEPIIVPPLK